jgi:DNA-binding PadR family transcriptional regulator
MKNELTNPELVLLGLVTEGPCHGYQIEQRIESRGMREWTEIGFSSIYYILNKLEHSGWLVSEQQIEVGLARRIYRVTPEGRQIFREAICQRLAHPRPRSGDFHLGLANQTVLSRDEIRQALETHRAELEIRLSRVRAKWAADRITQEDELPPHVNALFDFSASQVEAELNWLTRYIESSGTDR